MTSHLWPNHNSTHIQQISYENIIVLTTIIVAH